MILRIIFAIAIYTLYKLLSENYTATFLDFLDLKVKRKPNIMRMENSSLRIRITL